MWITPHPALDCENLAGLVERVTFHNEDSGFCVLRVKARGQRDLITVVGHAAAIGAGEFVQASGRWVNDRTHGVQFRVDFLRAAPPTTAEGIEKYLASGMIKGIGPIYAKKLVKAFREQVFDVSLRSISRKTTTPPSDDNWPPSKRAKTSLPSTGDRPGNGRLGSTMASEYSGTCVVGLRQPSPPRSQRITLHPPTPVHNPASFAKMGEQASGIM